MKNSIYNLYIPARNDEHVLFNTLTNSILLVDHQMKKCLEGEQFHDMENDDLANLKSMGIIVEDNVDELKIYNNLYNQMIHSNRELKFIIITTYKCNLSCPYCYEGKGEVYDKSMDGNMSDMTIQAIKNHVITEGVKNLKLMLFGGEPLLNPDIGLNVLEELSTWSKSQGICFEGAMVTNGTMVTPQVIEAFSRYIRTVQLTLDGPRRYHDRQRIYRNGNGTYDKILDALRLFRKAGIHVALRIQVSAENSGCIDELLAELKYTGVLDDPGVALNISPLRKYTELCSSYGNFLESGEADALTRLWKYDKNQKPGARILPCHVYSGIYIIDPYGDVYKCISTPGQKKDVVGTVRNGIIEYSYNFYDFMTRNPVEMPQCANCVYLPMCGGGCPCMARMKSGTYHAPHCGSAKELLDRKILYYMERKYPERFNP